MKDQDKFIKALLAQRLALGGPVRPQGTISEPSPGQGGQASQGGFSSIRPPSPGGLTPARANSSTPTANTPIGNGGSGGGFSSSDSFSGPNQLNFQAQAPTSNLTFNQGLFKNSVERGQNAINTATDQLTREANGQGPSLAQSQLQSATSQNAASAAGAIASQRGMNPALAARLIAQNQASANQGAAGQSAELRVHEQQGAQQQLGQMGLGQLGTSGRLLTDNDKMSLDQSVANQNAKLHAQDTNATISLANQGVAQHNLDASNAALGGALNGAGAALAAGAGALGKGGNNTSTPPDTSGGGNQPDPGYTSPQPDSPVDNGGTYEWTPPSYEAHGGLIRALAARRFADGGPVSPNDYSGSYGYAGSSNIQDPNTNSLLTSHVSTPPSGSSYGSGSGSGSSKTPMDGGHADLTGKAGGEKVWDAAAGAVPIIGQGLVAVKNLIADANYKHQQEETPAQRQADLDNWKAHPDGPLSWALKSGGPIPGRASVKGDSYSNDTVPAVLSPGEIVLPRSVTQAEDAPAKAKAFVEAIKKSKKGSSAAPQEDGGASRGGYGAVLAKQREIAMRLARLEMHIKGGK